MSFAGILPAVCAPATMPAMDLPFDRLDVDSILRGIFEVNANTADAVTELKTIRRLLEDGDGDQEADVDE
jgi:hypothetical protein